MDCIDENGNIFIGYIGIVKWRKFSFNYSNFLFYDALKDEFKADYSIKKSPFPEWTYPQLKWTHQSLKIDGEWNSLQSSVEEKLLQEDERFINWSCFQPLTKTKVQLGERLIEGLGYAEKLDLEIDPQNLPFETLRWGRFTADETSIVWIEWQGEIPLKVVYLNGVKYENVDISEESIQIYDANLELKLTESLELRKGSLLDTVFKNLHWLIKRFPLKMLSTFECKWRSKGVLVDKNAENSIKSGWAMHEIVIWE
ncbi:MAG: hypothetical protein K1X72_17210 [Pyrinomonadaceae bacterium]|nr:hypothetical protein [Pyrinomonadaceae bacterium]